MWPLSPVVQDSVDLGLAILVVLPLREVLHHVQSVVQSIQDKSVGAKLASALHDHGRVHESLVQELVSPLVRAGPSHLLQVQLDVVQHLREEDLLWKTDLLLILVEMAWVLWQRSPCSLACRRRLRAADLGPRGLLVLPLLDHDVGEGVCVRLPPDGLRGRLHGRLRRRATPDWFPLSLELVPPLVSVWELVPAGEFSASATGMLSVPVVEDCVEPSLWGCREVAERPRRRRVLEDMK